MEAWIKLKQLFDDLGAELKLVVGIEQATAEADDNAVVLVDEADKLFVDDV